MGPKMMKLSLLIIIKTLFSVCIPLAPFNYAASLAHCATDKKEREKRRAPLSLCV